MYSVEALLKQHLWYWLEEEKNMKVDAEVNTPGGRIDLVAKNDKIIGIELKGKFSLKVSGQRFAKQIRRYINSGYLDEIYFASSNVGEIVTHLESSDPEPIRSVLSQAARKINAGINSGSIAIDKAIKQIDREVPDDLLDYQIQPRSTVRDYIIYRMKNYDEQKLNPAPLQECIKEIRWSRLPKEMGVIDIPFSLQGGYLRSPRMALEPEEARAPQIVRQASKLMRESTPSFSREEEPWVRHSVWKEYGGIPEGVIPNVMEKESVYKPSIDRPIDIISFSGSWDPVDIYQTPAKGEIIGIEAKGRSSFTSKRVKEQLNDYLEPGVLTRLYLAVPTKFKDKALEVLNSQDELLDKVGLITVDKDGCVNTIQESSELDLKHDGYKKDGETYKVGYGDVRIPHGGEVQNPFDLTHYREPHKDDEGRPVIWDYNPLTFEPNIINETKGIEIKQKTKPPQGLMPDSDQCNNIRAYLATGYSADPYANGRGGKREPKKGYVRLTIRDFEIRIEKEKGKNPISENDSHNSISDGEFGLYLHFGRGSWEGGYICLVGKQVDTFVKILTSLENINSGVVPGWGRFIDLEEFRWEYGQNYEFCLKRMNAKDERPLKLVCKSSKKGHGVLLKLGKKLTQGAYIKLTKAQRIDLLRTIRIMRYGRPSEIPKGKEGYPRVGSEGKDTWDRGTVIEKKSKH